MVAVKVGVDYLEYTGQEYFNSLVQMSFLQDVAQNSSGRVKCRMHDLVHDLSRSILGDKISIVMPNEETSPTNGYRYFCLTEQIINLPPKNIFRKARAIYVDEGYPEAKFGKALKKARHLRSVTVECNYKAALPTTILQIKNLKYLEISELLCEEIPESISVIWSLEALHLTCENLVGLPESIGKLQKLRTLNLSHCRELKCLPDSIGDCQMISSIGLCKCENLTVLPNSIGKLQKLRTLNLSRCIKLKCLPDSIGDCQMISSIALCNCKKLTELPNSIGKLQKLRTLSLSRCKELKCLPDSIGECHMLSIIDIVDCKDLTALPNSIGKLQKLRTLNLSHCRELKCLPDSIGECHMLSSIDLGNCEDLTALPNSIGTNENLRVLRLGSTKIERLPSCITTLRNLECLDLNPYSELVELPEGIGNLEKLEVLNLKYCGNLRGMPVGIGQLSRLQKLELFVVGEDEKCARISELANIGTNSEDLTIRGIVRVMEPDDAHKACLKQKTNLQRLVLQWRRYAAGEVNTALVQAVLDGLEPPSGLKEPTIGGYLGRQYARWMQDDQVGGGLLEGLPLAYFPFLRVMNLCDLPNLKHLCGLAELPCLEELVLRWMPSLESISGGPFPSLMKLFMKGMPSLGEVWMVAAERTMPDGEEGGGCSNRTPHHLGQVLRVSNCLRDLYIYDCPKLQVKPYLPSSLQCLELWGSSEQLLQSPPGQCEGEGSSSSYSFSYLKKLELRRMLGSESGRGWELLQHMTALESLEIGYCDDVLTELPESLGSLTSLRSLDVSSCSAIQTLPKWLGELRSLQELAIQSCRSLSSLPQTMGRLTSLNVLRIEWCDALEQLPECLGDLRSLRELHIKGLAGLTCLPQSMCGLTSLEKLYAWSCPGVKSLPEGIKHLTALQHLDISGCPDLARRCERGNGEDWHLISHIPSVATM